MNPETEPGHENMQIPHFKERSLQALRQSLRKGPYPGYPSERLSYVDGGQRNGQFGRYKLPDGPWQVGGTNHDWLDRQEAIGFQAQGFLLDHYNRPVHPWIEDMLSDPAIGVVTGKGAYWHWGPNYTADPIVIRTDQEQPYVLLIKRKDTGAWALPGGFVDPGELAINAAAREAQEESGIVLDDYHPATDEIYCGPLADLRVTANAWPETSAYRFVLPSETTNETPLGFWPGGDDAAMAGWFAARDIDEVLRFGSHAILVQAALQGLVEGPDL